MVSLVGKHRLQGVQASVTEASKLQSADSVVVVQRLSCCAACEIFPDQGTNLASCISRQILYHRTTREAKQLVFLIINILIAFKISAFWGLPWQSSGYDSTVALLGMWVQFLMGELRSHMPCSQKKKKGKMFLKLAVFFFFW